MDLVLPANGAAFSLMAKPVGPACNLRCDYCYYLEKGRVFKSGPDRTMSDDVLESFIRQYIEAQQVPVVTFLWQGGEPTLAPPVFYSRALEFQKKYAGKKRIDNLLQTNATLLTDEWCGFLAAHNFLVGVSLDGTSLIHDFYRKDAAGNGSYNKVMAGLELLKKHRVEFNTLTTVTRESSKYPVDIYRFLRKSGSGFIQFLPVVERQIPVPASNELSLVHQHGPADASVTEWSVAPEDYGRFLCMVYDEWVRNDVGKVFVQLFDVTLANWIGHPPGLCVFSETCGDALAIEQTGDVFSCDHFVYPEFRLGNILAGDLLSMVYSPFQRNFGLSKREALPSLCLDCEYRFACHGDCPKHRFVQTGEDGKGLSYLCPAYKNFFAHVHPTMQYMADQLAKKQPPANVMGWLRHLERPAMASPLQVPGRNDPCVCGSGKKYKNCCMNHSFPA
ncbi:MAG: anaerobic sulfatase-maturation protein [Bacteroidales bacterium]